jgi:hypothetical protein
MMSVETHHATSDDPPALTMALSLLGRGLWPIVIYPGKKKPIGDSWGLTRPTEAILRTTFAAHPGAGVGVKLGADAGVIDIEIDYPDPGNETLLAMFGGEVVPTLSWRSRRGSHHLFRWDDRLSKWGKSVITVKGLEVRIGTLDPESPSQMQSVCPPSPDESGQPREWDGPEEIAELPDSFYEFTDKFLASKTAEKPASPPPTIPLRSLGANATTVDRAYAYVFSHGFPESVSGQRGHDVLYRVACELVDGFGLSFDQAMPIFRHWNSCKARPPESAKQLDHKLSDAVRNNPVPSLRRLNAPMTRDALFVNKVNSATVNTGSLRVPGGAPGSHHKHGVDSCKTDLVDKKGSETGSNGSEQGSVEDIDDVDESPPETEWALPRKREPMPAEPFPLDVLPASLADLCRAGAASVQCPVDYFASAALGLAGGVVGLSVGLEVKSSWVESPCLYLAIVGPPGTKKSPAIRQMSRPLADIDHDLRTQYKEDRKDYEAAKRQDRPGTPDEAPVQRQLTLDDATREAVADVHSKNPRGLVVVKDELSGWVASLNAYRQGKGDDKQFWLSVNSGSLVKVNRKGSPEPLIVRRPCVAIVGALTPSNLGTIRGGNADDGWLDRILFSYPEAEAIPGWTEEDIPADLIDDWSKAVHRLFSRPPMLDDRGRERPYLIHMDGRAKAIWVEWFNAHKREMADEETPRSLIGPWSKLEGFTARLALILTCLHQAYDPIDRGNPRDVDALAMHGATKLCAYFKAHFRRARLDLAHRHDDGDDMAERTLKWVIRHGLREFSGRDHNRIFYRVPDEERELALNRLIARRCIREKVAMPRPPGTLGRMPSTVYEVNPLLLNTPDDEPGPQQEAES